MPFKAKNINTREEEGNISENKIQIKDIEVKVYLDNDENNSEDDIKINFTNIDNENETNFINNEDDNNIERRQRAKSKNKPKKAMNSIVKSKKEFMINFLRNNDYTKNRELGLLYSLEEPKFYSYINQWLMSLNNKIYQKISPIAGKIINLIYSDIHSRNKNSKNINPKTLYRGFSIKKADIFLYKACEGDIFCYPSFTSMTSKEEVTYKFGKIDNIDNSALGNKYACIISVDYNIKNGCYVQECDFKRFSQYVKEEERLFPPFSFFKIKKVKFCSEGLHENEYFDGSEKHPFRIDEKGTLISGIRNLQSEQIKINNPSHNLTGISEMNVNKNSQMKIVLKVDDRQTSKNMVAREDIEMREDTKIEKLKKLINKNNV